MLFQEGDFGHQLELRHERGVWILRLEDGEQRLGGERLPDGRLRVALGGESFHAHVLERDGELLVQSATEIARLKLRGGADESAPERDASPHVRAPMPGRITGVLVSAGQQVQRGEALATLEAMKMEHTLVSPFDGVVAAIRCAEGEQVEEDVTLFQIDAREQP